MDQGLTVGASSVQMLVDIGVQRGASVDAMLEGTGLQTSLLSNPMAEVTLRQEYDVMRNLLRLFGAEPGLGILAGARYHLGMHGTWGLLMVTSPTFRESLEIALPLVPLSWAFTTVTLREEGDTASIVFDGTDIPADVRTFLIERNIGASKVIHRELMGQDLPWLGVQFRHPAPKDTSRHVELFGVEPSFGQPQNAFQFDAAQLDMPLPQANEWVCAGYEAMCHELLAKRVARGGVAGAVRNLLVERPGEFPDAAEVAERLAMSPRTLFRRLEDEGTSFRKLVDEVRETLAQELLVTAGMTTEQVARRLGYAEPTSFVRAFKRWTGHTPQRYRAQVAQ